MKALRWIRGSKLAASENYVMSYWNSQVIQDALANIYLSV